MKKASRTNPGLTIMASVLLMGAVIFADFSVSAALDDQKSKEVVIGVSDAYVPSNFNKNSEVFVVANGVYPNGCYRWSRAEVKTVDERTHDIIAYAKVQQGMCLMVLVPYNKEINLGRLSPGEHKLRFLSGDGTFMEKTVKIE